MPTTDRYTTCLKELKDDTGGLIDITRESKNTLAMVFELIEKKVPKMKNNIDILCEPENHKLTTKKHGRWTVTGTIVDKKTPNQVMVNAALTFQQFVEFGSAFVHDFRAP
jgi:hypothetical protein